MSGHCLLTCVWCSVEHHRSIVVIIVNLWFHKVQYKGVRILKKRCNNTSVERYVTCDADFFFCEKAMLTFDDTVSWFPPIDEMYSCMMICRWLMNTAVIIEATLPTWSFRALTHLLEEPFVEKKNYPKTAPQKLALISVLVM